MCIKSVLQQQLGIALVNGLEKEAGFLLLGFFFLTLSQRLLLSYIFLKVRCGKNSVKPKLQLDYGNVKPCLKSAFSQFSGMLNYTDVRRAATSEEKR